MDLNGCLVVYLRVHCCFRSTSWISHNKLLKPSHHSSVLSAPLEPQMWHWPMGVWPPTWFLKALLDLSLLNPLLIQILDELVTLHPVDERTDVSAVPEEGAARQVDGTSCRGGQRGRMWGVCCFNIWWEGGGVKDKLECWQKCLCTSGKLNATITAFVTPPELITILKRHFILTWGTH